MRTGVCVVYMVWFGLVIIQFLPSYFSVWHLDKQSCQTSIPDSDSDSDSELIKLLLRLFMLED